MSEILRSEKLNIGYDSLIAGDINIDVSDGEIVVLIGPNGSGKTTFIKTICGLIPALSGNIFIEGREFSKISLNERAKLITAVLTEKTYAEYTCEEMVAMGRYPYTNGIGSLSDEDKSVVREAMELTDTVGIAGKDFLKISDGQRQRVLLARAICQKPKLLILDEPTSFLDVKYKAEFLRLLRELSDKFGFSVIMSLHELDMAKQIADRIVCIKDGRIDRTGTPDDIFSQGYISRLFDIGAGCFNEETGLLELWHTK